MKQCKCGSFAINKDPERKSCDVCYAYQQGFELGYIAAINICAELSFGYACHKGILAAKKDTGN